MKLEIMHDADISMVLSKLTGIVYTACFYTVGLDNSAQCLDSIHCFRNRKYFFNAASHSNITALL
jgi:hypothetical protein